VNPEDEVLLERLGNNCTALGAGWKERVDYTVPVTYGDGRIEHEKRVKYVNRESLLEQLRLFNQNRDTDRNPKAERGAPRVKTAGKPPGDVTGFLTLDEITCEAYSFLDRIFEEVDRDRLFLTQPLKAVLAGLTYQVRQFVESRPDLARDILKVTDKWVRQAKQALRMTVSEAMFGGTVCGNCAGGLAVAWDNSSDVRCVGTPTEPPCGETYPMSEWVALYEKGKR
jgi:hypothetical protein